MNHSHDIRIDDDQNSRKKKLVLDIAFEVFLYFSFAMKRKQNAEEDGWKFLRRVDLWRQHPVA